MRLLSRRQHTCRLQWCMLLLSVLCTFKDVGGVPTAASEYQLKAVFLFNFTQFVDWPPDAFGDEASPLVIGVLGTDPFGELLDEIVRGERVKGRPLVVQRYAHLEDVKACHVLFVSVSETARLKDIFAALKSRSILTVGDAEGFARRGGVISFATVDNKIRLKINLEAAQAAHLTISSKLLRPADIVGGND